MNPYPDKAQFLEWSRQGSLIPIWTEILADTETPISALAKLRRNGGPAFLLESLEGGEQWGRYSFLGASAHSALRVYERFVERSQGGSRSILEHGGDPLAVLRSLMGRYRPVTPPGLPRFWGGAVGYITYEMVSFFESIPHRWPADKPLAGFILTDSLVVFDNLRHTLILIAHAFLEKGRDPERVYQEAVSRLEGLLESLSGPPPKSPAFASVPFDLEPESKPEAFRSAVARVKEYIQEGEVIQTVLSQPFVCPHPPDPWMLYRAQRYINPSPYLYFLQLDNRFLVGSSPETMVRLEKGVATLRPIAGTRPRGRTEQEDRRLADELLRDPKERAEHLMLVDLGRNDLGRIAEVGTVQVTELMAVERFSHVMHLVSSISCDVRADCDAWELLKATFPAGTLSGAPKVRAMEIIAQLEETPRGPYGGAVGYISFTGDMDLAITIRTACFEDGRLTVQAGAGIVADSEPEQERIETVHKAQAIQRALQLIGEGGLSGSFLETGNLKNGKEDGHDRDHR